MTKSGTVIVFMALILGLVSSSILAVYDIYTLSIKNELVQLRQDAHMLSIEAFYAETLNQVSWINKQLERIALLTAAVVVSPELIVLVNKVKVLISGLEYYQDFLLKSLPYRLLYYDKSLALKNNISVLDGKLFYNIPYKRGTSIDLGIIKIPGLIKFNKSIFNGSCLSNGNAFHSSKFCIRYLPYKNGIWFTPKEERWEIEVRA